MLTPTVSRHRHRQGVLQKATFRTLKHGLSSCKIPCFARQKGTFCDTSANALTIRRITICKLSARTTASDGFCSTTGYRPA